jgi:hypothetical protein
MSEVDFAGRSAGGSERVAGTSSFSITRPITLSPPRRLARWLFWASLAVHVSIALVASGKGRVIVNGSDFDNYYDIGTKPGRPYVDYPVEFPVATVQMFRTLAPITGNRARFGVSLVMLNVAADLAIVGALYWGWGIEAAACYALITIPLVDLFFLRMDLWSTAVTTIAVAAWRRGREVLTAIGLVAGAAFKLWPLMCLPLLLVPSGPRRRIAPLAAAAAAGLMALADWLWFAGPSGLYQVLTFRGARGWELESTVGAMWMLFDRSSMRLESGAWRIGTTIGPIAILLFALGGVPSLWMIWRGARTGRVGAGWAGGLSVLLATSALLSPQFLAWMAPASGVAWAEKDRRTSVLVGLAVFVTNLEFKSFGPLLRGAPRALLIVHSRNLLLAFIAFDVARRLARTPLIDAHRRTAS